jgi:hypothetical protein
MILARNRLRLKLDTQQPLSETVDMYTGSRITMPRARAVQFEVALYSGVTLLAFTGITSVTMEVKPINSAGVIDTTKANVMASTVSSALFNGTLTDDEWTNDSGSTPYHFTFPFSVAETTLTMTSMVANRLTFGWVITATTTNGTLCIGSGNLICVDDGGSGAGVPVLPVPTYTRTDAQIDAMLASKVQIGENPAGAAIILVSEDGTKKRILYVGDDGALHTEIIT